MKRFDGRLMVAAIVAAVFSAFLSLSIALWVNSRETDRQRAVICQAAKTNRQVLRDLIDLIEPSDFKTRAEKIVDRPILCETGPP